MYSHVFTKYTGTFSIPLLPSFLPRDFWFCHDPHHSSIYKTNEYRISWLQPSKLHQLSQISSTKVPQPQQLQRSQPRLFLPSFDRLCDLHVGSETKLNVTTSACFYACFKQKKRQTNKTQQKNNRNMYSNMTCFMLMNTCLEKPTFFVTNKHPVKNTHSLMSNFSPFWPLPECLDSELPVAVPVTTVTLLVDPHPTMVEKWEKRAWKWSTRYLQAQVPLKPIAWRIILLFFGQTAGG